MASPLVVAENPAEPTLEERQPAWWAYVIAGVVYVAGMVAAKFGWEIDVDGQALAGLVWPLVVFAGAAWRTRRRVNSPATVAKVLDPLA